jgi:hypothetical protein
VYKLHSAEALSTEIVLTVISKKITSESIGSIINIQDFLEQMQGR